MIQSLSIKWVRKHSQPCCTNVTLWIWMGLCNLSLRVCVWACGSAYVCVWENPQCWWHEGMWWGLRIKARVRGERGGKAWGWVPIIQRTEIPKRDSSFITAYTTSFLCSTHTSPTANKCKRPCYFCDMWLPPFLQLQTIPMNTLDYAILSRGKALTETPCIGVFVHRKHTNHTNALTPLGLSCQIKSPWQKGLDVF